MAIQHAEKKTQREQIESYIGDISGQQDTATKQRVDVNSKWTSWVDRSNVTVVSLRLGIGLGNVVHS